MLSSTLVAIDLDGTLLTDQKTVLTETADYLYRLQNLGIKIVLASGRPYRAIKPYYDQIRLNSLVISGNGALLIDPNDNEKILKKESYPNKTILDIIDAVGYDKFDLIMVEDGKNIFLSREKKESENFIWTEDMDVIVGNKFEKAEHPDGAIFILKNEEDKGKLVQMSNAMTNKLAVRFWGKSLVAELYFKEINKMTGVKAVQDIYHISNENTIAFGDDENDLEMISKVGLGVGMKNGCELIKKYSDMLSIEDNNNQGVKKTLELLLAGQN